MANRDSEDCNRGNVELDTAICNTRKLPSAVSIAVRFPELQLSWDESMGEPSLRLWHSHRGSVLVSRLKLPSGVVTIHGETGTHYDYPERHIAPRHY